MRSAGARARRSGAIRAGPLLVALFLVGLNLRTTMASLPPLLGAVEHDLRLTGFAAGALTGLPVLCMGVFAPLAHRAAHRLGREATVAAALAVLASGLLLRPAGGAAPALYAGTLLAGTGLALVGTILPGIVKEHFRGRPGLGTSAYSGAMALGAALAAGLAVPLADALGSWRRSLAAWAVPAVVALVVWAAVALRGNEYEPEEESAEGDRAGCRGAAGSPGWSAATWPCSRWRSTARSRGWRRRTWRGAGPPPTPARCSPRSARRRSCPPWSPRR